MTDKEVFETFMKWMGMKQIETKLVDDTIVIKYDDSLACDTRFTTQGYDEFYSGAVFNQDGKMIKGFIDSHVAYSSRNSDEVDRLLRE